MCTVVWVKPPATPTDYCCDLKAGGRILVIKAVFKMSPDSAKSKQRGNGQSNGSLVTSSYSDPQRSKYPNLGPLCSLKPSYLGT